MTTDGGPRVGVLALQGDVREHLGALTAAGARAVPVRRAGELEELDGLVVPGGESTTIGRLLDVFGLFDPLRKAVDDGLAVFGSCAGMILLASEVRDGRPDQPVLGAIDMAVRRNAFGRQVDSFEADLPLAGLDGPPFRAVFIRAPVVERAGADVEVLADVADRPVAVRSGRHLATAFHPELGGDVRVHELFVRQLKEARR